MVFTTTPKLYPFRGKMLSASAISRMTGIPYSAIRYRGDRGRPVDQPSPPNAKRYEFRGEMLLVKDIAAILGVNLTTVYKRRIGNRIAEGPELIDPFHESPSHAILIHHGGETLTAAAWAKRLGVDRSTVYNRIARGMDPVAAATTPAPLWAVQRNQRARNRRIVQHIVASFRQHRVPTSQTGGYVQTFNDRLGTGLGSVARDLQSENQP